MTSTDKQIANIIANYKPGKFSFKARGNSHTTTFTDGVFEFTRFDGGEGPNRGRWEFYVILQAGRSRGLSMFQGYVSEAMQARLDASKESKDALDRLHGMGRNPMATVSFHQWSVDVASGALVG